MEYREFTLSSVDFVVVVVDADVVDVVVFDVAVV